MNTEPGVPEEVSDKISDRDYQRYRDDYRNLEELEFSESERYDKLLIALSSGAFAVSIAFVKDIAPTIAPETKYLILWAWIFFLLSLTSIVISLVSSQYGNRHKREHVLQADGTYRENDIGLYVYGRVTDILNFFSFITLLAGAWCLIAFAYQNLDSAPPKYQTEIQQEALSMSHDDKDRIERGKSPSQPPRSPNEYKPGGGKAPSQPPKPPTKPNK